MTSPTRSVVALPTPGRIAHIDMLRAIAVLIVVVMHSGLTPAPGDGGVVLFFVISGYIITTLLMKEASRTGRFDLLRFYRRRGLKLGPPLIVLLLLPAGVYSATSGGVSPVAVLAQVAFAYNWLQVLSPGLAEQILPGSDIVWSLAIEEQFYIGFALMWTVLVRASWWRAATLIIALTTAALSLFVRTSLALGTEDEIIHAARGTDARIEAIAIGVALAALLWPSEEGEDVGRKWRRWAGTGPALWVSAILFLGASVAFRQDWSELALRPSAQAWAGALALAWGLLQGEGRTRRWVVRISHVPAVQHVGLASYSIYLAHYPVIKLLSGPLSSWPAVAVFTANVLLAVAVGVFAYRTIEVPTLALRERRRW